MITIPQLPSPITSSVSDIFPINQSDGQTHQISAGALAVTPSGLNTAPTISNIAAQTAGMSISTISSLRALTAATPITSALVQTFATPGDQGGGVFVVDPNDTSSGATFTGSIAPVAPPAAASLSSVAGGTIAATTYYVKLTYNTAAGQTLPSGENSLAVALDYLLVVASPPAATGATSYNVYVATSAGNETLQASGIAIGTSWTEPTSGLVAGAALPTVSTAGSILDVTAINTGSIVVNNGVYGPNVAVGTIVVAQAGGTGSTGNYLVNSVKTVASEFMTSDNGGTIIVDQAGRRWYRQYSGAVSVKWFGATGNGSTDDTASINYALNFAQSAGGSDGLILFFPAGNYKISTTITITGNAITLEGEGIFNGTNLIWYGSTGNMLVFSGQHSGVKNLLIESQYAYGGVAPSSGAAISFQTGSFVCFVDTVRIQYMYNAIILADSSETRIRHIVLRYLFGTNGIQLYGATGGNYRCVIEDLTADNPYPLSPGAVETWAVSKAFSAGQIIFQNNAVYQCVTSGTSASSGNGPNAPISFSATITDGTVGWKFVCLNLTWIELNSNSYSLVVNMCAVIDGVYGLAMRDGVNSGTSQPSWIFAWDLECDHNFLAGVSLEAGNGCYINGSWLGSCLNGNEVQAVTSFQGELSIEGGTRIVGAAQNGVLLNVGQSYIISNCFIWNNSQQSSGAFNGITVAANINVFSITDNIIGDGVGAGSSQGYSVIVDVGSNNLYTISGNTCNYFTISAISDGGTGTNKFVGNNPGSAPQPWSYLPDGSIIQSGTGTSGTGGTLAVTWPKAFPNSVRSITTGMGGSSAGYSVYTGSATTTGTTFTTFAGSTATSGIGFSWIAIGY